MRICHLELRNFRGIKEGRVTLPRHAVLLGPNNAGKSTIVEALTLLFGRDKMLRPLSDWDFFGGKPTPESRFYIFATLTDFGSNDPADFPAWFIGDQMARPVWWSDETSQLSEAADPPPGHALAVRIAAAARFDEGLCEFELLRYFYEPGDPFVSGCCPVPTALLREVGFFLLASNREWDRLLSFSSSSLLKLIKENDAVPGPAIGRLKLELEGNVERIEESSPLSSLLAKVSAEMRAFQMIKQGGTLAYRPTLLDTYSVLTSLTAHIRNAEGGMLPVARHGAGMVSLQSFMLLLAFAEHRRDRGRNFVLAAEEPELHLHPALHRRLAHRIRSTSSQSVVTTQSPPLAASYPPSQVVFIRNDRGNLHGEIMFSGSLSASSANSIKRLYVTHRTQFFEAIMGEVVIVPEGIHDSETLLLWQAVAHASSSAGVGDEPPPPLSIVPTQDAQIVSALKESRRFRREAVPLVDGDEDGQRYVAVLEALAPAPSVIIRHGDGAAIECLTAWILEPALSSANDVLDELFQGESHRSLRTLQKALIRAKSDRDLRERLAWSIIDNPECCKRCREYIADLALIAASESPKNPGWQRVQRPAKPAIMIAAHIAKA